MSSPCHPPLPARLRVRRWASHLRPRVPRRLLRELTLTILNATLTGAAQALTAHLLTWW